jgi:DNA-binding CsgD family transcriptional regulator
MSERHLYSLALTDDEWRAAASEVLLPEIGGDGPGQWSVISRIVDGERTVATFGASDEHGGRMATEFPLVAPRELSACMASTLTTTVKGAGLWTEATRQFLAELGADDAFAVSCKDEQGGFVMGRLLVRRGSAPLPRASRAQRIARRVRAAWRARCLAIALRGRVPAVFTPEGAVVAHDSAAVSDSAIDVLRSLVRAREAAEPVGTRAATTDTAAWWRTLVSGRWSLLDDYDEGGRRYVLAVPNDRGSRVLGRLSQAESRALDRAVQGHPIKATADEMDVSLSVAYALVDSALGKLGAQSIAEVALLVRALPEAAFSRLSSGRNAFVAIGLPMASAGACNGLTASERALLPLLLASNSQREISRIRNTSTRTVANQIASIYRKLAVSSRTELAMRLSALNGVKTGQAAPSTGARRRRGEEMTQ